MLAWLAITVSSSLAHAATEPLPLDVATVIRAEFTSPDAETRYLAGRVDLDDDGKDELVVHVVGAMACGSGGCPTLVFTPAEAGHRLVATISVSRAPIRVGTARAQGWRSLIVRVGGGGAKPHDVELAFDGTSYPSNPTVAGPRVTRTSDPDAEVVVAEFASFDDTVPLPPAPAPPSQPAPSAAPTAADAPSPRPTSTPEPRPAASAPAAAAGPPSFDCGKAASAAEKLVCRDTTLAALDRKLDAAYVEAMHGWSADEQTRQRAAQRAWLKHRDGCGGGRDARGCIATAYRRRLVEVQLYGGRLAAPKPVAYACGGRAGTTFTAAFYRETDPASVLVTFGDRRAIAFAVPAASGARYLGANVELREHRGAATMTWAGVQYVCRRR